MQILGFLPGYMYCHGQLRSTGAAIEPTQHVDPTTGEIIFYCRPFFYSGPTVGLYIKKSGLERAIAEGRV